ncbi:hypothetical protein ACOSQ4_023342 [Xanthoceras sorbifolium]
MRHLATSILHRHNHQRYLIHLCHSKPLKPAAAPPPPSLPKPPWMSSLNDKVAMWHMDMYMEQEKKYTEAVLSDTERLQSKLQLEMASRLAFDLSTPPLQWGCTIGVLCRRLASLNEEFISHKSPAAGFDFTSGKKIEQKLLDYNKEAERFGASSSSGVKYSMGQGWALLYVVTDHNKRPYRIYCSIIGSTDEDVLLLEESDENVYVNIRHTKDFHFVTVNTFSTTSSKVFLINAADPFSGMTFLWECDGVAHCIVEHHQGYLYLFTDAAKEGRVVDYHYLLRSPVDASSSPRIWESVFTDDQDMVVEDVDFCKTHLALIIREGWKFRLCSVALPDNTFGHLLLRLFGVPFLDATNTLLYPILPLTAADYEEFGYPGDIDDFHAIRNYSPYDNIQKDVLYPAVLVTSSFSTSFGVWEAAKWIARVRESTIYDPKRPILLNLTIDIVEENRYLQCKESALDTAFLIKMMES